MNKGRNLIGQILALSLIILVFGNIVLFAHDSSNTARNYEFTNGNWFNGEKFEKKIFYSVNGVFSDKKPKRIDETIDMENGFVIPPFGDSHTHNFENSGYEESQNKRYLKQGIFYARTLNNRLSGRQKVAEFFNADSTIDVAYANGGITAPGAHPIPAYEAQALGISLWDQREEQQIKIRQSRLRAGDAYFVVADTGDLEKVWADILAGKPDVLKIYLDHTEEFEADKAPGKTPRGIDPELVPLIVKKAHAAGLRTVAHVETVNDFRVAVEAGVDELAHMTGYSINTQNPLDEASKNVVPDSLLRKAANGGIVVTPTFYRGLAMIRFIPKEYQPDAETIKQVRKFHREQLKRLKTTGVPFAIGADMSTLTALDEALYYHELGAFDNLTLLKAWAQTTPRAIFPGRKIGFLKEGFEASFLVLRENPLEDFKAVKTIEKRFKHGKILEIKE